MPELDAVMESAPPAQLADYYKPVQRADGKTVFVAAIRPVNGWALEDVSSLKGALSTERERAAQYERQTKAFGDWTPDKLNATVTELESLRKATGSLDAQVKARAEAELSQHQVKWNAEKEQIAQRSKFLEQSLRGALIEQNARAALSRLAVDAGAVDVLLPHAIGNLDMREEDGRFQVVVLDEKDRKTPRISMKTGNNGRMTIDEYVESVMAADQRYQRLFKGKTTPGGGTPPGADDAGGGGGAGPLTITNAQAHNPSYYQAAKAKAKAEGRQLVIVA